MSKENSQSFLAQLEELGSIQIAKDLASLEGPGRKLPIEKYKLFFSCATTASPTQLLTFKQSFQELLDLKGCETELKHLSELFGNKVVELLNMLSEKEVDEAHISSIFGFLGSKTTFAIRRDENILYNQGLDLHTLAIATRRVENLESHSCAIASGELFSCSCGHYQGYFLRETPFEKVEISLIKLYLNLLSRSMEQQKLYNMIVKLNDLFSNSFNLKEDAEHLDPKRNMHVFEKNFGHLLETALKDSLTQAFNRNKTSEVLSLMCKRQDHFAVIIIDVDHFKKINDTHGHLIGDKVLVELVKRLSSHIRQNDILARWGGEEFLVLIPVDKSLDVMTIAERMRHSIAEEPMAENLNVTISLGVSMYQTGDTPNSLLKRADAALYTAKNSGRNQVVMNV